MIKLLFSFSAAKLLREGYISLLLALFVVQNVVTLTNALPAKMEPNSRSLENPGLRFQGNSIQHEEENQTMPEGELKITVFPWNNHLGRPGNMEWSVEEVSTRTCKEIPSRWQKKVRSVNTYDNCVVLFSGYKCDGPSKTIKVGSPSHNRLSDICFQRKPLSARPCTKEEKEAQISDRV